MLNKEWKMDEIGTTFERFADACVSRWRSRAKKKMSKSAKAFSLAVHELRKISARLEIEMVAFLRESKWLNGLFPFLPHRVSRREPGSDDSTELPGFITDGGSMKVSLAHRKMQSGGSNGPCQARDLADRKVSRQWQRIEIVFISFVTFQNCT